MTSEERADRAKGAVWRINGGPSVTEERVIDLIIDLLYLAQEESMDPVKIAAMALFHYQSEV